MNTQNQRAQVFFLPGIIMPAALRYAPLIEAIGNSAHTVAKDLEVYATQMPPPDYSIEQEIEGIDRAANDAGFERFHLYGHSAGGAIALAYAAQRPDRVLSLALDEPATDFDEESNAKLRRDLEELAPLPEEERFSTFVRQQISAGVDPPAPPPGPPPAWMANRPAGLKAFVDAVQRITVLPEQYRRFDRPVYYSYGSLSHPYWTSMRDRLAAAFPDFTAEKYDGLHHFRTSHAAEPARVAVALQTLWSRAPQS